MPLSKKEFDELLERYLQRKCSSEEQRVVEQWYKSIGNSDEEIEESLDSNSEARMWKAIQEKAHLSEDAHIIQLKEPSMRTGYLKWMGIAASFVIASLLFVYYLYTSQTFVESPVIVKSTEGGEDPTFITIRNNDQNSIRQVRLSDGSLATLQPNSELRYRQTFVTDKREVTLIGEAFFEIKKDAQHPFLVHTEGLVTRVLGTSFNIKARPEDKTIVVDVKTGKVAVYRENNKASSKEYFLTPNQQAVYNRVANEIVQKLQEDPQIIIPDKEIEEMKFDEAPVSEVFAALEKAYGVEIVYDSKAFKNCQLTTHLANEGLYERLIIICKALGANYETKETKILIDGKGCE